MLYVCVASFCPVYFFLRYCSFDVVATCIFRLMLLFFLLPCFLLVSLCEAVLILRALYAVPLTVMLFMRKCFIADSFMVAFVFVGYFGFFC